MRTFATPWPKPHKAKASLLRRFVTGWNSWIHTLAEPSYTMKLGHVRLPRLTMYVPNDPALVAEVMEDAERIYPKHSFLMDLLGPLIGSSVFSANGRVWEEQRAMVNPSFQHTALRRSFPLMLAAVEDTVARIAAHDATLPLTLDPLMTHVAADIIFRTMFSVPLDETGAEAIFTSFHAFQQHIQPSALLKLYRLPQFGRWRRAEAAARAVHAVFLPVVRRRYDAYHEGGDAGPDDILASLLAARHPETGAPFTLPELINQISTIFLAGHETAASSMTWALWLLAEGQDWQDAVRTEVAQVAGDRPLEPEMLKHLHLTRNVFQETLRLYPPVSFFLREVTRATTWRGKRMKPGSILVISPWLVQRSSNNWRCPHDFDPERFARDEEKPACRHAYLPFGRGPRICIGAGFATQEALLVLASVVRRFRLRAIPGDSPKPISRLTLRPAAGARVLVEAIGG